MVGNEVMQVSDRDADFPKIGRNKSENDTNGANGGPVPGRCHSSKSFKAQLRVQSWRPFPGHEGGREAEARASGRSHNSFSGYGRGGETLEQIPGALTPPCGSKCPWAPLVLQSASCFGSPTRPRGFPDTWRIPSFSAGIRAQPPCQNTIIETHTILDPLNWSAVKV